MDVHIIFQVILKTVYCHMKRQMNVSVLIKVSDFY